MDVLAPIPPASVAVAAAALAGACAAAAIAGLAEAGRASREMRARRAPARGSSRLVALAVRLGRLLGARAAGRRDVEALLDAVGAPPTVTVADVLALEAGGALTAGLAALPLASLAPGRLAIVVLLGAPASGFLAPGLVLRRRARRRAERIEAELADVAELMRVAVEAGIPPARALGEVGRRHPGLLAAELRAADARMALGVAQDDALTVLVRRAPVPGVAALAGALRRAGRHGAPPGPVLAALAADARAERARRVRDRAARAAPKIQLVVALLLVPAVLLLVAASLAGTLGG